MIQVGLTGGLGAGKSTVARVLKALGVPVYDSDLAARRLLETDEGLRAGVTTLLGKDVFTPDGKPDRKKIAASVFADEEKLAGLNALVHPAVKADYAEWLKRQTGHPYVIREAAILIETGLHRELDHVIVVDAPEALRIQRVGQRDGRTSEEAAAIISRQWTTEARLPYAGHVIVNDHKRLILPQILNIHYQLTQAGAAKTD